MNLSYESLFGFPFITSQGAEEDGVRALIGLTLYSMLKRFLDILVSLALLGLLLPVMIIISILIRLSSPGAAIYCQQRLTDRAKTFTMFKFRTMASDAEASSGAVMADVGDPRITKIGTFLRRTRLDELPQLLNVVIGDMSLVGPRPERPELARTLREELPGFQRRTKVRAGLTGLAQTKSGYASNVEGYREKLALDLLYIKRRSLLLDLQILFNTIWVVVSGKGAR